ncbi:chloride channel protein [Pararcticibacter amylolyticus]|uniref:Chloride channel protein n=1 Tax=Pararcticibacter amylolyticus TaxID=2173175 RepID=A0A2U2PK47_9SPHI|nr:chloride channel protein [Pararcticibacter amylolyticus]PWG81529.1 chloride channel protein [Pararcticibacter amylolyticus]
MEKFNTIKKYHSFLRFKRDFTKYGIKKARSFEIFIHWLKSKLSRNQFLIFSGILVGITAGLAGVLLKSLVAYIHYIIHGKVHFKDQIFFYLVFPFLGIVLTTAIVILFFKGQDRKGIPAILYEIAQNSSLVSSVKMYSQIIQSAVTVGLGGSAGLESPIAVTGSAIGSNFARRYNLDYRNRTLLLAAGATAGIASAFNAPIAGVMFAFEVLLTGVVFSDFIPLVVAAVCGSLLSKIILNEDILFHFKARNEFNYANTLFYVVLGIASGLYARYFVVISSWIEHLFKSLRVSKMQKAMIGGALLSLLCLLLPPLFGEGYQTIKDITNGQISKVLDNSFLGYINYNEWIVIAFLGLVCLLKVFATGITIQSGGNGGNFAPSLFAGGMLGFFFASICTQLGLENVPSSNLVLAGMAGVMSGVMYAPLTAVFLIAESSEGYDLFIPLMIVTVISYLMARWFSPIAPDLEEMARKGKIFTKEHDKNLLSLLNTSNLIEREFQKISSSASFSELLQLIKNGRRNVIAVIDQEGHLEGTISLDDLRPYMFNPEAIQSLTIRELTKMPSTVIDTEKDVVSIIRMFDESGAWNLPVTDADGRFLGFISKSNILMKYRQLLKEYS